MALLELLEGVPCQVMVSGYPSDVVRGAPWGLAQRRVAGDEPGRCAHREAVVQLRPRAAALGTLRGTQTSPTASASSARPRAGGRRYAALPLAERLAVLGAMMAVEAER